MARWRLVLNAALIVATVIAGSARAAAQAVPPAIDPTAEFFDDSVVHELKLWINSRDWNTLKTNFLSNAYYPADFVYKATTVRNVGIRSRGNGSRSGFKPGLRVDIDRYSTTQKFLGLKSFVLRNNTQDPSQLHEFLSMQFFRRMGLAAPREAFARLFVNNEYVGLYTIVESVDKSFLTRQYGEDSGYLFDYDYPADAAPYYFEDRGTDPAAYVPLPFKPETHESDPHPEVIVNMVQAINTSSAALFRNAVNEFIDLTQLMRYVATEVFLGDQDGFLGNWGMNNFFIYRAEFSNQFRWIVWDKSQAFVDGPAYPIWHNVTDVPSAVRNRLMARAIEFSDLRDLYLDTLLEAGRSANEIPIDTLPGDTRGWLEREIDRMFALISPAVLTDTLKPYTNEEFLASVDALRFFARERTTFVNAEVTASRPGR
jgi:spore coat protein CotH